MPEPYLENTVPQTILFRGRLITKPDLMVFFDDNL